MLNLTIDKNFKPMIKTTDFILSISVASLVSNIGSTLKQNFPKAFDFREIDLTKSMFQKLLLDNFNHLDIDFHFVSINQ